MQIIICKKENVENSCYYRTVSENSKRCCMSCDFVDECFEPCEFIEGDASICGCEDDCMKVIKVD